MSEPDPQGLLGGAPSNDDGIAGEGAFIGRLVSARPGIVAGSEVLVLAEGKLRFLRKQKSTVRFRIIPNGLAPLHE